MATKFHRSFCTVCASRIVDWKLIKVRSLEGLVKVVLCYSCAERIHKGLSGLDFQTGPLKKNMARAALPPTKKKRIEDSASALQAWTQDKAASKPHQQGITDEL